MLALNILRLDYTLPNRGLPIFRLSLSATCLLLQSSKSINSAAHTNFLLCEMHSCCWTSAFPLLPKVLSLGLWWHMQTPGSTASAISLGKRKEPSVFFSFLPTEATEVTESGLSATHYNGSETILRGHCIHVHGDFLFPDPGYDTFTQSLFP